MFASPLPYRRIHQACCCCDWRLVDRYGAPANGVRCVWSQQDEESVANRRSQARSWAVSGSQKWQTQTAKLCCIILCWSALWCTFECHPGFEGQRPAPCSSHGTFSPASGTHWKAAFCAANFCNKVGPHEGPFLMNPQCSLHLDQHSTWSVHKYYLALLNDFCTAEQICEAAIRTTTDIAGGRA